MNRAPTPRKQAWTAAERVKQTAASATRYDAEEEQVWRPSMPPCTLHYFTVLLLCLQVRKRFEGTLINERARLKARLDQLESEHQTLLGNVRRLQTSILAMQVRGFPGGTREKEKKIAQAARTIFIQLYGDK